MKAWLLVLLMATLSQAQTSQNFVLAFHGRGCPPCQRMIPSEDFLRIKGHAIFTIDMDNRQYVAKRYAVTRIPTYIYIVKAPGGEYQLGRYTGWCPLWFLARMCQTPTLSGAAVRNLAKGMLGGPVFLEG